MRKLWKNLLLVVLAATVAVSAVACSGSKSVEVTGYYISKTNGEPYDGPYGEVTMINGSTLVVYSDNTYAYTTDIGMGFGSLILGSTHTTMYGTYTAEKDEDAGTIVYALSDPTRVIYICTVPTQEAFKDSNDENTLGDDTLADFMANYKGTTVTVNVETGVII